MLREISELVRFNGWALPLDEGEALNRAGLFQGTKQSKVDWPDEGFMGLPGLCCHKPRQLSNHPRQHPPAEEHPVNPKGIMDLKAAIWLANAPNMLNWDLIRPPRPIFRDYLGLYFRDW